MLVTESYLTKPYDWQRETCIKAFKKKEYALLAEMGTGKTKCQIDILRHNYATHGRILKTVIFSPIVTLFNWKKEFGIHSKIDPKKILVLHKASRRLKDFEKYKGDALIIIVNYESVGSKLFYKSLKTWCPEIIVGDEMHILKSHKSKRAKNVIVLGDNASYRYGMTGTPILNSPMDIFNQWRFLDKGETFGKSFFKFRAEYFQDSNAAWAHSQAHFPKWEPIPSKFSAMTGKIEEKSIRVLKSACLDLPPLVKKTVPLQFNSIQKKAYDEMRENFITFVESKKDEPQAVVAQLAMTKALRLQQICSGFVITDEGETVRLKSNVKLDWVKQFIPELVKSDKVIIWTAFKEDIAMISEVLDDFKIEFSTIQGGQKIEDRQEGIDSFNDDTATRVMLANRSAGGIGINLIAARISVIFSRNFKLSDELQSEARNHRGGSEIHDEILQISLCVKDTTDEITVESLGSKKDISKRIIDVIRGEKC